MPEIKNTFLKGKMSKDLDSRLVPNGEYVDAQNIHITKSEGSDVGVVQNIKGNLSIGNITISGDVIGYIAESESQSDGSNRIFYFFKGQSASEDAIYYYNTSESIPRYIVKGAFLNFSTSKLITGVNIIDELLFWTDDNNQPRKINIEKAIGSPSYYNNEDKISVAKYYPYNSPQVLHPTLSTQGGMKKLTTTGNVSANVNSGTNVTLVATNYNIFVGQMVTGTGVPNDTLVQAFNETTKVLTLSKPVTVTTTNPILTFTSQEDRLEEEFIKFAYRYKFEDGEYSVISPFTQTCFLPKTYNNSNGLTTSQILDASKTTEIESMINDIGLVQLRIKLPSSNVTTDYGINKIEILYKEADNPGVKAVAEIVLTDSDVPISSGLSYSLVGDAFTYDYKLTLPFKTLTEDQVTRVFDNVPRKAKAQEIAGSRLIYGNFQENYNLPVIDFEAGYVNRAATSADQNWNVQYPYQSVKSRRTYQIGLVLADKYGRQSPVILPDDKNKSSVRVPVHTPTPHGWNGYSLRVEFNDVIPNAYSSTNKFGWYSWKTVIKQTEQEYYNVYAPAIKDNFPHGAISASGQLNTAASIIMDGIQSTVYTDDDSRSWLVLHGDNVNKVPKEAGAGGVITEQTSGSDAALYPVINNASLTPAGTNSDPYIFNSDGAKVDVISIGTAKDQGLVNSATRTQSDGTVDLIYEPGEVMAFINVGVSTNPLVAELPNGYGHQRLDNGASLPALSIWETEPFKSGLDIYYETSLSGLVSDLNSEISDVASGSGGATNITIDSNEFSEGLETNVSNATKGIIGALGATNSGGSALSNLTFQLNNVFAQSDYSTDLVTKFDINSNNLRIISDTFYYGQNGESYDASITVTDSNGVSYTDTVVIHLTNAAPTFSNSLTTTGNSLHYSVGTIANLSVGTENGSRSVSQKTLGLTYSIVSVHLASTDVTSSNLFTITNSGDTGNPDPGRLKSTGYMAQNLVTNQYTIIVKVVDAGHTTAAPSQDTHTITITITPGILVNYLTAPNAAQLCNPTTQTLYITKPQLTGPTTIEVGDTIYTSNALGTNYFFGNIVTQPIGGAYDQGLYADVRSQNGVVQEIGLNISCAP